MVKRSIINIDLPLPDTYDYIDLVKGGVQFGGPSSAATWKTGSIWGQVIDANGWATFSTTTRSYSLGGVTLADSSNFAGPYTLDGQGTGRISFAAGTWTLGTASGVTQVSNGIYDVVDSGSGWTCQLTYSGAKQVTGLNVSRNDPSATGSYLKNVRLYRTSDASDLAAGKVFRTAYKQMLADWNPSAIRFMNWTGCNEAKNMRFENRTKPSYAQWSAQNYNWVASLPYGETTGTNQYSLSAVAGTPASMQHGETVTCRIGNTMVRCGSGSITVSAITKANPGVVTATGHGFNTGDVIVHINVTGMTQLVYIPCTITVLDANTYSIGIDTTSFGTFTAGTARQFISLQVGSGGDRTKATGALYNGYPVVFPNGTSPASTSGNSNITSGDYKTFYFDKTVAAQADASGTLIYGAWIGGDFGPDLGHAGGAPLEGCVALINELMQMTRTDGGSVGPIDLWVTIPHMALLSMDPDYSAASNFAIGTVDVCLNGANGYSGLNSSCKLYVEYSNETWNSGGGFRQTNYLNRRGFLRWPSVGTTDIVTMHCLRSMIMVQDILGASQNFPRNRLKFILAGQGTQAMTVGGLNQLRMDGNTQLLTDPLNVGGVTPMSVHDSYAWAAYIVASAAFDTANLATLTTSWIGHAGDPVAQEADCASYVVGLENTGVTSAGNETLYRYRESILPAFATGCSSRGGKTTLMYEGGWDRSVSDGSTNQNNFLKAVKRSRAWAKALKTLHDKFDATSSADAPADYIVLNSRWGHTSTDSYGATPNGVEWSGLDLAWDLMSLRNRGKRQFLIKT